MQYKSIILMRIFFITESECDTVTPPRDENMINEGVLNIMHE